MRLSDRDEGAPEGHGAKSKVVLPCLPPVRRERRGSTSTKAGQRYELPYPTDLKHGGYIDNSLARRVHFLPSRFFRSSLQVRVADRNLSQHHAGAHRIFGTATLLGWNDEATMRVFEPELLRKDRAYDHRQGNKSASGRAGYLRYPSDREPRRAGERSPCSQPAWGSRVLGDLLPHG